MKTLITLSAGLLLGCSASARDFQKTYGAGKADPSGYQLLKTTDGHYLQTGSGMADSGPGNANILLVKTDEAGNVLWNKALGGAMADMGFALLEAKGGGYLVAGSTYSFGAGKEDAYLIRTDTAGNILWSKTYGGSGNDNIMALQPVAAGGYLLCGTTSSFGAGGFDIYLLRIDEAGDTLWTRTYGGREEDNGLHMQTTRDGAYIITGYTRSFGAGQDDAYLLKVDADGKVIWSKTYGGADADAANFVWPTYDGGYLLTGKTHSFINPIDGDLYLIRTNETGDTLWTRQYGGSAGTEWGYGILETRNDELFVIGDTYSFGAGHSDMYLLRTDKDGNLRDSKTYGGTHFDYGRRIGQATDGGLVFSGQTSSFGAGQLDFYLVKEQRFGDEHCNQQAVPTIGYATPSLVGAVSWQENGTATRISSPATLEGGGLRDHTLCSSPTNISEAGSAPAISLFPNPSDGVLQSVAAQAHSIRIFEPGGRQVYHNDNQQEQHRIDLHHLAPGIYIGEMRTEDGGRVYQRILLQ